MWRFSFLCLVAIAAANPQYGPAQSGDIHQTPSVGPAGGYPVCDQYSDCVPLKQCVNGFIDTTGTGSLDLRGGPKKTAEQLGHTICGITEYTVEVCCKLPVYDYQDDYQGPIVPGGGGYVDPAVVVGVGGHVGVGSGHVGIDSLHAVGSGNVGTGGAYVDPVVVSGGGYNDGTVGVHDHGGIHGSAPVSGPPYSGCSAGLLCVEEITCNLYTGFIGARIPLFEGQPFIQYKHCTTEYLSVGVCCQEVRNDAYVDPTIGGAHGGIGGGAHGGVGGGAHGGVGVGDGYVDQTIGGGVIGGVGGGHGSVGGGGGYVDPTIGGGGIGGGHGGVGGAHGGVGGAHGGVGVGGDGYVDPTIGGGGYGGVGGGDGYVDPTIGGGGHGGVGGGGDGYVDPTIGGGGHGGVGGVGGDGYVDPTIGGGGIGGVLGGIGGGVHSEVGGGLGGVGDYSGAISIQCGVYEECVLKEYCDRGWIVSDGAGIIDLRGKFDYNKCIDPQYPKSDAVCCRVDTAPEPVNACPNYEVCTDYQFCNPEGYVSTDPFSPQYSSGTECYQKSGFSALTGVCCKPSCPLDSVCIPEELCFGDIQSVSGNFGPYSIGGSWAQCGLAGQIEPGTCCKNPIPTIPTKSECGVSQYAQTNSLKTRYKTPHITKLEADFGEFPWQAIVFFSNYTFRCGATIISDKHLLTAAHCVRDHYPEDFRIRVGEWQVNTFTEPYPYHDYGVGKITFHPRYKSGSEHNNLVVLELDSPMTLAYNVNTVCLPPDTYTFPPGTRCFVSGWGKDSFVGDYQHILKKIDVPLVEHSYCQSLLRHTRLRKYFRLHSGFLCAGGEEGKDACTGDGGGPLVCLDANKQYVLAGVTSWGIGCGVKDVPGVYADVSQYVPWILETIQGVSGTQYGK